MNIFDSLQLCDLIFDFSLKDFKSLFGKIFDKILKLFLLIILNIFVNDLNYPQIEKFPNRSFSLILIKSILFIKVLIQQLFGFTQLFKI